MFFGPLIVDEDFSRLVCCRGSSGCESFAKTVEGQGEFCSLPEIVMKVMSC